MLTHLTIRNLAVIEHASFELTPGLNVLTGETGAGKSILVDALDLLRGTQRGRARVRDGASYALVEAQFLPDAATVTRLAPLLERYDIETEEELVLARKVDASGRTRSYVQGRLVPRAVLAELGERLIDICGQHDSHALRSPSEQLAIIDASGNLADLVRQMGQSYAAWRLVDERLRSLSERSAEAARRRDFIDYQLAEFAQVQLQAYAVAKLRAAELRSDTARSEVYALVRDTLGDSDDSVSARVAWLLRKVGTLAGGADDVSAALSDALVAVDDAVERALQECERVAARLGGEGGELDELEALVSEVERLARKHRRSPEELAAFVLELTQERDELDDLERTLPDLEGQSSTLRAHAQRLADELHAERERTALELERAVAAELEGLCLPGARLHLRVEAAPLGPLGASSLEIGFSANAGHAPAPLGRVASGGELSRVLLALRVACRQGGGLAVFDEIDAGAGGATAERIGERLRDAAEHGQVLCVTHWPQVAAQAAAHFTVVKDVVVAPPDASAREPHAVAGPRVTSRVESLSEEARLEELARMLGGRRSSAREHAAHLFAGAKERAPGRSTEGRGVSAGAVEGAGAVASAPTPAAAAGATAAGSTKRERGAGKAAAAKASAEKRPSAKGRASRVRAA